MSDGSFAAFMAGETEKPKPAQPAAPKPKGGSFADFMSGQAKPQQPRRPTATAPQRVPQPQQEPGLANQFQAGAAAGLNEAVVAPSLSLYEAGREALSGNFGPAKEIGILAARGVWNSLKPPSPQYQRDASGRVTGMTGIRPADPEIERISKERQVRQAQSPLFENVNIVRSQLAREAAQAPSLKSKIARGAGQMAVSAAPAVAGGVLGGVPAMAGIAGLQSANQPEMIGPNIASAVLPAPPVAALVRRLRGRGGRPTGQPPVRETQPLPQSVETPNAPTTNRLPAISARLAESAPTAELQLPAKLPAREVLDKPPALVGEEFDPLAFGVRENLNPPRQTAGARGPRFETELALQMSKSKASQPPIKPPDIDGSVGKWERRPQQQPLFDAAAKSPWQDSVLSYYRANLLTNPAGRATDFASTVINQGADALARPIAAAIDTVVSKLTGQRSITGPSLTGSGRAFGSIRQGLRDAREVLRTGKQTIDSGVDEALYGNEIRTGLGKAADAPINGVFRVLGAMDAPFRRFGFERNLADRAKVAALNESRRGLIPRNQVKARAAELVDRGDIIEAAVRDGERAVLSEPNRISSWLSKQTQNSPNARLAVGLVQPFFKLPLNAILRSADFAGVGGIKALYKIARGGVRKAKGQSFFRDLEDQRVFAQNVASGSFAPAAFLLGMELEESGRLEGYYHTGRRDFPNGQVPTSININGENYDINRLGGYVLAPLFVGATFNRLRKQDVGQANALLRSFSGLVQQAPALGYYGAPAKAGRILSADEPGAKIVEEAGSIASGFIPASGAAGAVAKAVDKGRKRETPGFTGPIAAKIPGLRETLPEKEAKGASVKRMKGEPDELFNARRKRVEEWSGKYGKALTGHPEFKRLTPDQQKQAVKKLRENINSESNDREPNLDLFDAYRIIYQAKDSERERAERNKRKIYVEP